MSQWHHCVIAFGLLSDFFGWLSWHGFVTDRQKPGQRVLSLVLASMILQRICSSQNKICGLMHLRLDHIYTLLFSLGALLWGLLIFLTFQLRHTEERSLKAACAPHQLSPGNYVTSSDEGMCHNHRKHLQSFNNNVMFNHIISVVECTKPILVHFIRSAQTDMTEAKDNQITITQDEEKQKLGWSYEIFGN